MVVVGGKTSTVNATQFDSRTKDDDEHEHEELLRLAED